MVFPASAWPLSPILGDTGALKTVAVISAAAVVLLVYPLARAAALTPTWAVLAQILATILPVLASRLSLALYPTLFGLAWVTVLVGRLARRLRHLDGARDGAAALTFVLIAEAAYTGSLLTVSLLVLALSTVLAVGGEWRRALRLGIGWAIATAILMLTMYVGFLPTLWGGGLPHVFEGRGAAAAAPRDRVWMGALRRPPEPPRSLAGVIRLAGRPSLLAFGETNHAAGHAAARIAGRLRLEVVGIRMDDHRVTDDAVGTVQLHRRVRPLEGGGAVAGRLDVAQGAGVMRGVGGRAVGAALGVEVAAGGGAVGRRTVAELVHVESVVPGGQPLQARLPAPAPRPPL